jgi:hypothetical protein
MKQYGWFVIVIFVGLIALVSLETENKEGGFITEENPTIHVHREVPVTRERRWRTTSANRERTRKIGLVIPSTQVAQKEMAKDPHSVPSYLVKFAAALAPYMEASLNDEKYALNFFSELQQCALANSADEAARALCVRNARSMALRHPSLLERWDILNDQLPDAVKSLSE